MSVQMTFWDLLSATSSQEFACGATPCVLPDGLTTGKCGQDHVLASHSLAQESSAEQTTSDTCGLHGSDSYKHDDLSLFLANRCFTLLNKAFNLAIKWHLRTDNPCKGVQKHPEEARERYMTNAEYAALIEALNHIEPVYPAGVAAIKVLMLTGARLSEIVTARREWLRDGVLYLPDSKTGKKQIRFPDEAVRIVEASPEIGGWLCGTGIRPTPAWKAAMKRSGIQNLRIHDMRHSFASILISKGYSLAQIGELLGHRSPTTTHRYAHLIDDIRKQAVKDVAESIFGN